MVLLQFALELAAHQFRDGVLRGFSAEERVVHGVHYREFHVHLSPSAFALLQVGTPSAIIFMCESVIQRSPLPMHSPT